MKSDVLESPKQTRQTVNINKRRFSTSEMMVDFSKVPGIVVPEIDSEEPKFAYHETWSYLKRKEPNMVVQAIIDLADNGYLNLN